MDSGSANKISIAFVVFFAANSLINLTAIISNTTFKKSDVITYTLYALVLCVVSAIPMLFKRNKGLVMSIIMILTGLFKFLSSDVGDVSGMSLVVTGALYYIIQYGISYRFIISISLVSLAIVTYVTSQRMIGVTLIANTVIYTCFAFFIRSTIYSVNVSKSRDITPEQHYIIKSLAEGKIGKEIHPELSISLRQYNNIKEKLREQTGAKTDAQLIAWCKDNKII